MLKGFIDFIIGLLLTILICSLFIAFLSGLQYLDVKYKNNIPVVATVDGQVVYEGPNIGIRVESTGRTTKLQVYAPPLYIFPQKLYVSDSIKVSGAK
jgi:hypothetical protein